MEKTTIYFLKWLKNNSPVNFKESDKSASKINFMLNLNAFHEMEENLILNKM
nr:hypothetical protein [uncultured Allomuricauda sp.]